MKYVGLIVCFVFISISCKTSNFSIEKVKPHQLVKLKGDLYNWYGKNGLWIFRERTKQSNHGNTNSFIVNIARYDLGYAFIEDIYGIGEKAIGKIYDKRNQKVLLDTIQHFYCEITVHPIKEGIKMDSCDYEIKINNRLLNLSCVYFDNYLVDVQPLDSLPRAKYLNELGGYKPQWAR